MEALLPYLIPLASVLLVALWDYAKNKFGWLPARPETAEVTALVAELLKDGKLTADDIPVVLAFIQKLREQRG